MPPVEDRKAEERRRDARPATRSLALAVLCLLIGAAIGRSLPGMPAVNAATPAIDATATRTAELAELNELRTKVAEPVVCTPPPTATPTSTPTVLPTPTVVPPVQVGTAIADKSGLVFTFLGVQPAPPPADADVAGQLLRVRFSVANPTDKPILLPFVGWRLVAPDGARYGVDIELTPVLEGVAWASPIGANQTEERSVVFVVPADAGTVFVLENEEDPTFRVELRIESRG